MTRRQATLYLTPPHTEIVELLRSRFNPVQFGLIRAHVTLCRDEDVADWEALSLRLARVGVINVTLAFETPIRDGNLVYLPATSSDGSFDRLRHALLGPVSAARKQHPHLTLIHPRNGTCSDAMFDEIRSRWVPFTAAFREVTLIEQIDGGRWMNLVTFSA
ncbi:MAG: 2'-5' RNA ligase family protein [Gemmatimonadota bacterium]